MLNYPEPYRAPPSVDERAGWISPYAGDYVSKHLLDQYKFTKMYSDKKKHVKKSNILVVLSSQL
jgi:hypothetical protein